MYEVSRGITSLVDVSSATSRNMNCAYVCMYVCKKEFIQDGPNTRSKMLASIF
jgi:hypothetical protein